MVKCSLSTGSVPLINALVWGDTLNSRLHIGVEYRSVMQCKMYFVILNRLYMRGSPVWQTDRQNGFYQ